MPDFIPRGNQDFHDWQNNFVLQAVKFGMGQAAVWTHVPLAETDALVTAQADWVANYNKTLVPHTTVDTQNMRDARRRYEPVIRRFKGMFVDWDPVTDGQRVAMGLHPHDSTKTPQPVPTTVPEMEFITSVIRQIGIRFRDFGSTHWAKPEHVHTIEFRWAFLEDRPDSIDALIHTEHDTANPHTLDFGEDDRGRRIFVAARWLNNTMQPGPWSDIESAFIP